MFIVIFNLLFPKIVTRMATRTSSKEHNTTGSIRAPKVWTLAIRALWAPTGKGSQATLKVLYRGTMEASMCSRTHKTGCFCIVICLLACLPTTPSRLWRGGAMSPDYLVTQRLGMILSCLPMPQVNENRIRVGKYWMKVVLCLVTRWNLTHWSKQN